MKFTFKKSVGSISLIVAEVMCILAFIFSIMSDAKGGSSYPVSPYGMVISFCILSILFIACAYVLDSMFEGKLFAIICDVLRIVSAALLVACFSVMVSSRGDLMGYIWFSDLEKGNEAACAALNYALVSWIFYIVSMVALAVSVWSDMCVKTEKKDNAKVDEAESDGEIA